jgi:hypothetical protein
MVAGPLRIHYLREQQLLQSVAVSEHIPLPQAGSERRDCIPASHCHLIEWLSMSPLYVLNHHIAMDEV